MRIKCGFKSIFRNGFIILVFLSLLPSSVTFGQPKLLYSNGGLEIYNSKAIYNSGVIYDAVNKLKELKQNEDTINCPVNYVYYYNPLSLIGKYYSYEAVEQGQYACGPPGNVLSVKTIDLKSNELIGLSDLFDERSLIDAIKNDVWIKNLAADHSINLNNINNLDSVFKLLKEYRFEKSGFAVLNYDFKAEMVSIRLVGYENIGYDDEQYIQLGLLVSPRSDKKNLFKMKDNFYIDRFKNGLYR